MKIDRKLSSEWKVSDPTSKSFEYAVMHVRTRKLLNTRRSELIGDESRPRLRILRGHETEAAERRFGKRNPKLLVGFRSRMKSRAYSRSHNLLAVQPRDRFLVRWGPRGSRMSRAQSHKANNSHRCELSSRHVSFERLM